MDVVVGTIKSKSSIVYTVEWDSESGLVWVSGKAPGKRLVCENVKSADDALSCAQQHIEGQPDQF